MVRSIQFQTISQSFPLAVGGSELPTGQVAGIGRVVFSPGGLALRVPPA